MLLCGRTDQEPDAGKSLLIGGFIPGINRNDYYGYLTALEMARDWLNKNHVIPDNYTIQFKCRETVVSCTCATKS